MTIRTTLAVPLLILASACNPAKNISLAEGAVTRFHQQYNQQRFDAIHAGSDATFKENTSAADFNRFGAALYRKLAPEVGSKRSGWNVQALNGGSYVTLTYDTRFQRARGAETFRFRISGGKAQLEGYNINSDALVTN